MDGVVYILGIALIATTVPSQHYDITTCIFCPVHRTAICGNHLDVLVKECSHGMAAAAA